MIARRRGAHASGETFLGGVRARRLVYFSRHDDLFPPRARVLVCLAYPSEITPFFFSVFVAGAAPSPGFLRSAARRLIDQKISPRRAGFNGTPGEERLAASCRGCLAERLTPIVSELKRLRCVFIGKLIAPAGNGTAFVRRVSRGYYAARGIFHFDATLLSLALASARSPLAADLGLLFIIGFGYGFRVARRVFLACRRSLSG